jgi:hypothetical protein
MHVHRNNLAKKEADTIKYADPQSKSCLAEIRQRYDIWKSANLALLGPLSDVGDEDKAIISKRVGLLNDYKDFVDQQKYAEMFDSRSNLHSTILEEFMYFLFKDMVTEISQDALLGKSHTFKDLFFRPDSYHSMLASPSLFVEKKDHDFAIGVRMSAMFNCANQTTQQQEEWDLPAVAIECKTYLDKTMLQDASTAAEQLKYRNPNALYIVVAEWLKLTEAVNLRKFKIDQVYVLRKQKNTDREYRFLDTYQKNPIYEDVVLHLFDNVRSFLTSPWQGGIPSGLERGYLI